MPSMSCSWGVNRGCVRRDMKAYVKATSWAVSGLPSCHLIPWRRRTTTLRPLWLRRTERASHGCATPFASRHMSVS